MFEAALLAQQQQQQMQYEYDLRECKKCRKAQDIDNARWACDDLKYRVGCDPKKVSLFVLILYGRRFINSQKKCHDCRGRSNLPEAQ